MAYGGVPDSCSLQRGAWRPGIEFYDTTLMFSRVCCSEESAATGHGLC